jgi:hemolysin III
VNPLEDVAEPSLAKPRLRGVSHCIAFFAALAGWAMLVKVATSTRALVAGSIYGASLAVMFGVSGLYHTWPWSPGQRRVLRRLDHAAIFVLIAGTYTPLCLALEPSRGLGLLAFVVTGAVFGVVKAMIFPDAPRYVVVPIYLGLGWAVFPLIATLRAAVGAQGLALVAAGGIAYSVGALIYGIRRPDPIPTFFGYHEVFHLLVIAAAACHFAVVFPVVRGLR